MFILLMSNLSSLTLNPVYLKWTPNVVVIHVHCRKHIYQNNRLEKFCVEASPFVFNFSRPSEQTINKDNQKIQETIILFLNAHLPRPILRISDRAHIENLGLLPLLKLRC